MLTFADLLYNFYGIAATAGVTEHGSSYNVLLIYEHNLKKNAYSLITGPFGQIKGTVSFAALLVFASRTMQM